VISDVVRQEMSAHNNPDFGKNLEKNGKQYSKCKSYFTPFLDSNETTSKIIRPSFEKMKACKSAYI
jgi:hypothetical protein